MKVKCPHCGEEKLINNFEEMDVLYRCAWCNRLLKIMPYSIAMSDDGKLPVVTAKDAKLARGRTA